jgi:hypothetical protein
MSMPPHLGRRAMLGGVGAAAGGLAARQAFAGPEAAAEALSAHEFGARGDGKSDDTESLQRALDAAFAGGRPRFLTIPPGDYRVTRTLRVAPPEGAPGNIGRQSGILAHGARIVSAIADGSPVVHVLSRSTVRFVLIEGLEILGAGQEGHGILVACDRTDAYFYNFCLRDIVVQECGGDGLHLEGNVFEGQLVNCYARKNRGNGATFAHGRNGGILSAIHVFAAIFGDNGGNGAALVNRCYDVSFHGCYFLLNGKFGLAAENGCTLLSNCGFENNHQRAKGFADGDAGMVLSGFATLIGCTAYSVFNQTALLRAFVVGRLTMIGCTGSGDGQAKQAILAHIGGEPAAGVTIVGCGGTVAYAEGSSGIEMGSAGGGLRLPAHWHSPHLPQLGDYRLWVDQKGRLRLKRGVPEHDEDGTAVGA